MTAMLVVVWLLWLDRSRSHSGYTTKKTKNTYMKKYLLQFFWLCCGIMLLPWRLVVEEYFLEYLDVRVFEEWIRKEEFKSVNLWVVPLGNWTLMLRVAVAALITVWPKGTSPAACWLDGLMDTTYPYDSLHSSVFSCDGLVGFPIHI